MCVCVCADLYRVQPVDTRPYLEGRVERGDRAGKVVADDEGDDANHREASVLELGLALARLLLGGEGAREVERIPELDLRSPEADDAIKGKLVNLARDAAAHVVRLLGLGGGLEREDDGEDLQLALGGDRIPRRVRAVGTDRRKRDALGDLTREGHLGGAKERQSRKTQMLRVT